MTPRPDPPSRKAPGSGFTLIELLVAMTVLTIVLVAVVMAMQGVQSAWRLTRTSVREFLEGRRALETVATHLSIATLASRWTPVEPAPSSADAPPPMLAVDSDLHFVCGTTQILLPNLRNGSGHAVFFQAPFGYQGAARSTMASPDTALYRTLPHTLSAWGYYVEFGRDPTELPPFMTVSRQGRPAPPQKNRFRLMEFRQPAHELALLAREPGADRPLFATHNTRDLLYDWFRQPLSNSGAGSAANGRRTCVVAENILAVLVVPYDPQLDALRDGASNSSLPYQLAPDYHYDSRRFQWDPGNPLSAVSRHALPPSVQIAIVALGEDSWENLSEAEAQQQGQSLLSLMSGLFNMAANFRNDLKTLEDELNRRRLSHKILTQVVSLQGLAGRLHTTATPAANPSTASNQ